MDTQVSSGTAGHPAMESDDWRTQLLADSREGMVNKILDTLKRNLPFFRHEELQELKNIAERIEDEIYTAATSQSEYSRKMCFMMLTMETRLQNLMSDSAHSNSAALYKSVNPSLPLDSTASGGDWQKEVYQKIKAMKDLYLLDLTACNSNGEDWQEEVYQKIKAMKDLYLLDLNDLHQKIVFKLQQLDSLPQQLENQQLEKLKLFKNMLERFMQFLQIPKHGILPNYKEKLGTYEMQIISVINVYKRKLGSAQQQSQG